MSRARTRDRSGPLFAGAGTTALAANQLGRDSIYIDLNPDYADMAKKRIGEGLRPGTYRDMDKEVDAPLFGVN